MKVRKALSYGPDAATGVADVLFSLDKKPLAIKCDSFLIARGMPGCSLPVSTTLYMNAQRCLGGTAEQQMYGRRSRAS